MDTVVSTLRTAPLFAELPREVLARLVSQVEEVELPAGHTVFSQREPGDALFVVVSGAVEARDDQGGPTQRVALLGPGDRGGEMARVAGDPRSGTVATLAETRLLRLEKERFRALSERRPRPGGGAGALGPPLPDHAPGGAALPADVRRPDLGAGDRRRPLHAPHPVGARPRHLHGPGGGRAHRRAPVPGPQRGSAGLALAAFTGFCQATTLFLTGTPTRVIAWRMLPDTTRAHVSWLFWLAAVLVLEAVTLGGARAWIAWRWSRSGPRPG